MKPKYCCSYSARTVQKHWMYSYIYIYKREKKSTNRRLKKKDLLQPLGTVATVQNWKEKKKGG